nr:hypothetical protein Iba_chr03eCG6930 [Ipomoea batatas]
MDETSTLFCSEFLKHLDNKAILLHQSFGRKCFKKRLFWLFDNPIVLDSSGQGGCCPNQVFSIPDILPPSVRRMHQAEMVSYTSSYNPDIAFAHHSDLSGFVEKTNAKSWWHMHNKNSGLHRHQLVKLRYELIISGRGTNDAPIRDVSFNFLQGIS